MNLQSLKVGMDAVPAMVGAADGVCGFCGQRAGLHAMRIHRKTACVLCGLVRALNRPTIDDEVRLIWLPEMTQSALNVLVRQIHIEFYRLGESTFCDDVPETTEGMLPVLYYAGRLLRARATAIAERLGSSRPSDLADALSALSARIADVEKLPMGGLRVFPAGRFFVGGDEVYKAIIDSWIAPMMAEVA